MFKILYKFSRWELSKSKDEIDSEKQLELKWYIKLFILLLVYISGVCSNPYSHILRSGDFDESALYYFLQYVIHMTSFTFGLKMNS